MYHASASDPFVALQSQVIAAFADLRARIEDAVAHSFETVEVTAAGVDLDACGLSGPSSTWTYVVQENPYGDLLLHRNLQRLEAQAGDDVNVQARRVGPAVIRCG